MSEFWAVYKNVFNCEIIIWIVTEMTERLVFGRASLLEEVSLGEPGVSDPQAMNYRFFFSSESRQIIRCYGGLNGMQFDGFHAMGSVPAPLPSLMHKCPDQWEQVLIWEAESGGEIPVEGPLGCLVSQLVSSYSHMPRHPTNCNCFIFLVDTVNEVEDFFNNDIIGVIIIKAFQN